MNLINYLQFLEPMQENIIRFYSIASGLIVIVFVLWAVNSFITLIQRVYAAGRFLGSFYHRFLHSHMKSVIDKFFAFARKKEIKEINSSDEGCRTREAV